MDRFHQIIKDKVFLGPGSVALGQADLLADMGVTHILNASKELPCKHTQRFQYLHIPLDDCPSDRIADHFAAAHAFIDQAVTKGGAVYVHCFAGVSRSATLVVSYVMKRYGYSLERALDFVRRRRPCIRPNVGFMQQLTDYEKQLRGPVAQVPLIIPPYVR